jgi:hypothetical protein
VLQLKKPARKKAKNRSIESKKPPLPPIKSEENHKKAFEQLLDDAVVGVKKK